MRSTFIVLAMLTALWPAVSAQASDCETYFDDARDATTTAERYVAQANADSPTFLSQSGFKNPSDNRNCSNLNRLYRIAQKAMNAYNEARINFEYAAGACGRGNAADLNDRARIAQRKSDKLRSDLRMTSNIGNDNECRVY